MGWQVCVVAGRVLCMMGCGRMGAMVWVGSGRGRLGMDTNDISVFSFGIRLKVNRLTLSLNWEFGFESGFQFGFQ